MMEEAEESRNGLMRRLKSCSGTSPSTTATASSTSIPRPGRLDLSNFNGTQVRPQFRYFPPSPDAAKRIGIPPAHPHFSPSPYQQQISNAVSGGGGGGRTPSSSSHHFTPVPTHSRSLSQPSFFNLDSLPQFTSPSPPFADTSPAASDPSSSADVEMDDRGVAVASSHFTPPPVPLSRTNSGGGSGRASSDGLPPRKAHRRSQSDIPFGFLQSSVAALPPLPHQTLGFSSHLVSPRTSNQLVKQETEWDKEGDGSVERKSDGDVADDLFSAYMNLESLDTLNSSGTEEKREDSRASGTKTTGGADSSENEAESCVNEGGNSLQLRGVSSERKEGNKRSAAGDPAPVNLSAFRHNRSISMDSFMGKVQCGEDAPKLPPSPGPQQVGQHSRSGSLDGMTNTFCLEFGNGEFTGAELKKIMANEKLAEIAMADPKRAKRILANRQSAARSKERKMRYISELEHKVQTLQTEATTLSAQLTLLQRDSAGLTSQNNELKFRLQAMEQQAQLRDALNEALTSEVQRLKLVTGEAQLANSLNQQMQLNPQMFSLQQQLQKQQQQSTQVSHYQMQSQQQPQQQQQQQKKKNNDVSKHDSSK